MQSRATLKGRDQCRVKTALDQVGRTEPVIGLIVRPRVNLGPETRRRPTVPFLDRLRQARPLQGGNKQHPACVHRHHPAVARQQDVLASDQSNQPELQRLMPRRVRRMGHRKLIQILEHDGAQRRARMPSLRSVPQQWQQHFIQTARQADRPAIEKLSQIRLMPTQSRGLQTASHQTAHPAAPWPGQEKVLTAKTRVLRPRRLPEQADPRGHRPFGGFLTVDLT